MHYGFQVITAEDLSDLTAEDLQLLLSGRGGAIMAFQLSTSTGTYLCIMAFRCDLHGGVEGGDPLH